MDSPARRAFALREIVLSPSWRRRHAHALTRRCLDAHLKIFVPGLGNKIRSHGFRRVCKLESGL